MSGSSFYSPSHGSQGFDLPRAVASSVNSLAANIVPREMQALGVGLNVLTWSLSSSSWGTRPRHVPLVQYTLSCCGCGTWGRHDGDLTRLLHDAFRGSRVVSVIRWRAYRRSRPSAMVLAVLLPVHGNGPGEVLSTHVVGRDGRVIARRRCSPTALDIVAANAVRVRVVSTPLYIQRGLVALPRHERGFSCEPAATSRLLFAVHGRSAESRASVRSVLLFSSLLVRVGAVGQSNCRGSVVALSR